jgi:hypothetical protein
MLVPGVRIPVKQAGRTGEQSLGFLHDQDGKRIYFEKSRALVEMRESEIVSCDLFQLSHVVCTTLQLPVKSTIFNLKARYWGL